MHQLSQGTRVICVCHLSSRCVRGEYTDIQYAYLVLAQWKKGVWAWRGAQLVSCQYLPAAGVLWIQSRQVSIPRIKINAICCLLVLNNLNYSDLNYPLTSSAPSIVLLFTDDQSVIYQLGNPCVHTSSPLGWRVLYSKGNVVIVKRKLHLQS